MLPTILYWSFVVVLLILATLCVGVGLLAAADPEGRGAVYFFGFFGMAAVLVLVAVVMTVAKIVYVLRH